MGNISENFAEIIGLLCSEGSYICTRNSYYGKERGKIRYYKNHKQERIEFYNKDIKLLNHLKKLLEDEFNYSPNITKNNKINICKRDVIKTIITQTELGHLKWRVPKSIIVSKKDVKEKFIRGFFDGDGTASNRVRIFSTNYEGLSQISNILKDLNFRHTIQGPELKKGRKPFYTVQISQKDKESFLNRIQPISKRPDNLCEGNC